MKLSETQAVKSMAGAIKQDTPRLDPVPEHRVAQMIGEAVLGGLICLVGLGILGAGIYIIVDTKDVKVLSLVLVGGGLAVFFTGAIFISKKLVASLMNIVTVGKAIRALVKGKNGT